ncbi:hypothetical protein DMB65_01235 [Flavobacterium cheongpyeongense]|uniref:Uncharacterized protein n=1 Tax=Flavobacterium cheongpyeongense TaxID=2212651 RepID=A0A2V4BVL4_9FLAO|nr:hypothetical protein DMB65_01235 [Flavobacterium cheongpyeongense]
MTDIIAFSSSLLGLFFLILNTFLFFKNKQVREKTEKTFLWYLFSLCIVEIICHLIGFLYFGQNFFVSHFYFYFQLLFLSILFKKLISNTILKKVIWTVLIAQTVILASMYIKDPNSFWNFNNYEIISISIILILYALYYIISNLATEHRYFNFSIGLILYFACSVTIFSVGNLELVLCEDPFIDIWIFNIVFYIIFQIFIFKEYLFLKSKKQME